jgi:hypothetical protein
MTRTPALLGITVVALIAACEEPTVEPQGPTPGELVAELTTPNSDDGALRFVVTAQPPASVISISPECVACLVFSLRMSDTETRAVVTGALGPGPLIRVVVSDTRSMAAYRAQVQEVASQSLVLRATHGYSLALVR